MNSSVEASTASLPLPTPWWRGIDGVFLTYFSGGAAWIVCLKWLGFNPLYATVLPVLLILSYAIYAVRAERFKGREYWAADNLYYLGFLYTLTSLAVSIAQFSAEQSSIGTITSNFGIALATTIVGLALRIVLSQIRQDPTEFERQAHVELSQAVKQFRARLDDSTKSLDTFHRDLMQTVRTTTDTLVEQTAGLLETHGTRFTEMLEKMSTGLRQSASELPQTIKQVNEQVGDTVKTLKRLNQRIDAIETPHDLLERKLEPAAAALGRLIDETTAHLNTGTERFDRLQAALETALTHYDKLNTGLEQLNQAHGEQVTAVLRATEGLRTALVAVQQTSAGAADKLTQNAEQQIQLTAQFIKSTSTVIEEHRLTLSTELNGMRERLNTINRESEIRYSDAVRTLEHLRLVVERFNEVKTTVAALNTQAAQQTERLLRLTQLSETAAQAAEANLVRLAQASEQTIAVVNAEVEQHRDTLRQEMVQLQEIMQGFGTLQATMKQLGALAGQQGEVLARWTQSHEQALSTAERYLQALHSEWQQAQAAAAMLTRAGTASQNRLGSIEQILTDSLQAQRELAAGQAILQHQLQQVLSANGAIKGRGFWSRWFGRRG